MGKQDKAKKLSYKRQVPVIVSLLFLGVVGWGFWQSELLANWKDQALQYIENKDIATLESRFSPEQILELHRQELLNQDKRTVRETTLKYYPYLLLEVKYQENQKTHEGVLLWGLNEGEMVLNTDTWETTHGFRDCLDCQATAHDFKILQTLARHQGSLTVEELQKELHLERDVFEPWIESVKKKHLIVQKGSVLQLHFENPKLLVTPQTRLKQHLVSKPLGEATKVAKTYSRSQVIELAKSAFGNDFKIRSEQEIFLPVYSLVLLNPDGSVQTSEWNALTGQRIPPRYWAKNNVL